MDLMFYPVLLKKVLDIFLKVMYILSIKDIKNIKKEKEEMATKKEKFDVATMVTDKILNALDKNI